MKDNITWVPHETEMGSHPKCQALIAAYGYEGYGRFHRLNELIGRSEGCRLDLRRKVYFNQTAGELRMTPAEFREFIAFLADPDECGLLHNDGDILWTTRVQDALISVRKTRADGRERQQKARQKTENSEPEEDNAAQAESNALPQRDEGTEHIRAEQTRKAAAAGFQGWLEETIPRRQGIHNPDAFIKAVLKNPTGYPDLLEEFHAQKQPAPAQPPPPAPRRCDSCGSTSIRQAVAVAECVRCGRHWELSSGVWIPDPETGRAPPGTGDRLVLEGTG